jgi:hypothetical protein
MAQVVSHLPLTARGPGSLPGQFTEDLWFKNWDIRFYKKANILRVEGNQLGLMQTKVSETHIRQIRS